MTKKARRILAAVIAALGVTAAVPAFPADVTPTPHYRQAVSSDCNAHVHPSTNPVYSGPAPQHPPGLSFPPFMDAPLVTVRTPCAWTRTDAPSFFPNPTYWAGQWFVPEVVFGSK